MTERTLDALARILVYPEPGYAELVRSCRVTFEEEFRGRQREPISLALDRFFAEISGMNREELEELYTRTFDLNPVCSLDLGWHLYAENYDRGAFLVAMRDALRAHGIPETNELPDHLPSVLKLLARIPEEKGEALVRESVMPAMKKMMEGFGDSDNPFRHLIKATEGILHSTFHQESGVYHHG